MDSSSSEEEGGAGQQPADIAAFTKFDESIVVRNAEEVQSPRNEKDNNNRMLRRGSKTSRTSSTDDPKQLQSKQGEPDLRSPRDTDFRRYSVPEDTFAKPPLGMDSETSDSEDSDEQLEPAGSSQKLGRMKLADYYDPKQFEDLEASTEVKELFQNVTRYTPQKIDLHYKLIPFVPDYIPAVGDIDAFLKVPRPDGALDKVGLAVLDEPAAEQSEPAVLHLQLRSRSRSAANSSKVGCSFKCHNYTCSNWNYGKLLKVQRELVIENQRLLN